MTNNKPPLIALVGPTAVGKTAASLAIAKTFDCEIISGDSMQVYRGMDIGTAKLPLAEREGVPHHLIDIKDPHEPFSAADFQAACGETIRDIQSRGRIPFIVGGTGLYVESVCYGFGFQPSGGDPDFRASMQAIADSQGADALHAKLAAVDPVTAAKLHPNDVRRVIRALEILKATGRPASEQLGEARGDRKESPYNLVLLGLHMDRAKLYARIDRRVDDMLAQGLEAEVRGLLDAGLTSASVSMQALGYKEMVAYLEGRVSYDEAVTMLKRDTRRFAKRQLSWFRHMQDLVWIDTDGAAKISDLYPTIYAIIAGKLK